MFSAYSSKVKRLNLKLMSSINKSRNQTAFTVSIESRKGISTGISAYDRAKTIKVAIKKVLQEKILFHLGMFFL